MNDDKALTYWLRSTGNAWDSASRNPFFEAADRLDALSAELAEAKAEIERMREALEILSDENKFANAQSMAHFAGVASKAALIPAKGKGE